MIKSLAEAEQLFVRKMARNENVFHGAAGVIAVGRRRVWCRRMSDKLMLKGERAALFVQDLPAPPRSISGKRALSMLVIDHRDIRQQCQR